MCVMTPEVEPTVKFSACSPESEYVMALSLPSASLADTSMSSWPAGREACKILIEQEQK